MVKKSKRVFVQVEIHSKPLKEEFGHATISGIGAELVFVGIVRHKEKGRPISALRYEIIRPLAEIQLKRLANLIAEKYGLLAVLVQHSEGIIPAGKPSFRLAISTSHRKKSFAAMQEFINEMKRFVAIDKQPIYL